MLYQDKKTWTAYRMNHRSWEILKVIFRGCDTSTAQPISFKVSWKTKHNHLQFLGGLTLIFPLKIQACYLCNVCKLLKVLSNIGFCSCVSFWGLTTQRALGVLLSCSVLKIWCVILLFNLVCWKCHAALCYVNILRVLRLLMLCNKYGNIY